MSSGILKAPFPYFGGKSRVAGLVWERFGRVSNFVEPFFGSGAVLLGCPHPGHTETVNDIDALLANFWRALASDPEQVAHYADYPVSEVDLHARHKYLRAQRERVEELMSDPDLYDTKLAGWWVWGISQWIGSGWCPPPGIPDVRQLPHVGNAGRGVHRASARPSGDEWKARPFLSHDGQGVHRKRPIIAGSAGGAMPLRRPIDDGTLLDYLSALSARLRRVRVCCGDWTRVLGPSVTFRHGLTAIFLDPPYVQEGRANVYGYEHKIFEDVRQWAIENGGNPLLRIALCGYAFSMPDGWKPVHWKAAGGYGSQGDGQGRANASREIVYFSPHCLDVDALPMFANFEREAV